MQCDVFYLQKTSVMGNDKISSGKKWMDTLLDGGFDKGQLYVVGGAGVNWLEDFIRQTAVNIGLSGKRVLLFSLEQTATSFVRRIVELEMDTSLYGDLSNGDLSRSYKVEKTVEVLKKTEIYVDDESDATIDYIVKQVRKVVWEKSIDVICVDMLTLVRRESDVYESHIQQLISKLSVLAKEKNKTVIASLRVNRNLTSINAYGNIAGLKNLIYIKSSPRDHTCIKIKYYPNMVLFSEALIKLRHAANYNILESEMVFVHWACDINSI